MTAECKGRKVRTVNPNPSQTSYRRVVSRHLLFIITSSSSSVLATMSVVPPQGNAHAHPHPPQGQPSPQQGPPRPMGPPPSADPAVQAAIDASFRPVNLTLNEEQTQMFCGPHKLEKCEECDVDYVTTNRLAALLVRNPNLLCPPPPNVIQKQLTATVNSMKEEGNVRFWHAVRYIISCAVVGVVQTEQALGGPLALHPRREHSRAATPMGDERRHG